MLLFFQILRTIEFSINMIGSLQYQYGDSNCKVMLNYWQGESRKNLEFHYIGQEYW